jgi:hypothetical protein
LVKNCLYSTSHYILEKKKKKRKENENRKQ